MNEIAFSLAKGMVGDTAIEMLRRIGSPDAFFSYPASQLRILAAVDSQIFDDAYRQQLLEQQAIERTFIEHHNITASFYGSEHYPHRLENCPDAPMMLYKLGTCDLNNRKTVGIVGTRHATPYGIEFATKLVRELAEMFPGILIVSGLAYGIDSAAHKAALSANTPTAAVLAHGLNMIYPADHRGLASQIISAGGALVTEYTSQARIHRGNFLARNRIVAGMCDCIVVVESDFKGGAMSTARTAQLYNRDVFAVPGRANDLYSRGTNALIAKNTAALITSAEDLAAAMAWQPESTVTKEPRLFKPLTGEQQTAVEYIRNNPSATVNEMCVALKMTYSAISDLLFQLEMEDVITLLPGGRYAVNE